MTVAFIFILYNEFTAVKQLKFRKENNMKSTKNIINGIIYNIDNLILGHNFETDGYWRQCDSNRTNLTYYLVDNETESMFGTKMLCIESNLVKCFEDGVFYQANTFNSGEYTFSVYTRVINEIIGDNSPGVYIRVKDIYDNVIAESEHITKETTNFIRLNVSFKLEKAEILHVELMINGKGVAYFDGAQLENNGSANAYNLLESNNFQRSTAWSLDWATYTNKDFFNMNRSLRLSGNCKEEHYSRQNVPIKKSASTRETFILSGWANGGKISGYKRKKDDPAFFRLSAAIRYFDGECESYNADFSPYKENWQFAFVEFEKQKYKEIKELNIYCECGYIEGDVLFDNIQLIRTGIKTNLTSREFI